MRVRCVDIENVRGLGGIPFSLMFSNISFSILDTCCNTWVAPVNERIYQQSKIYMLIATVRGSRLSFALESSQMNSG
jgi:hypothetical protein